jgi:hypothetical protein
LKALKADGDVTAELQAEFIKNPGGVREILDLKDEAKAAGAQVADVFAHLDDLKALAGDSDLPAASRAEFLKDPTAAKEVLDLKNEAKAAGADAADVFANFDDLKALADGFKDEADADRRQALLAKPDKAAEVTQWMDKAAENDANADPKKIVDSLDDFITLAERYKDDADKFDLVLGNPEMADQMESDPGLVDLAQDDPAFFATVKDSDASNENISSSLLNDLKDLGLSGEELTKVLADLNAGPGENQQAADLPAEKPADAVLAGQSGTVSLLASQVIEGNIDPNLILSSQQAFASEFFETVAAVYGELADPAPVEGQAPPFKVFGGKTITVNAGQYDVGNVYGGPTHDDFLVAAADKLTVVGNIVFNNTDESLASTEDGLKLFSAGSFDLSGAEQISYAGDTLTLGSFDTMEVIDVDLAAEGKVSVRSLDSLVINNVEMATAGNGGADFVHLRAFGEISATNLRFSEQVRQIAMSAMTINLTNVTFPGSSQVNLNSLYGGVNGKYPTFGSANQAFGRVNFINQVRYGTNLLNSPAAFDQHGGAITIGVK